LGEVGEKKMGLLHEAATRIVDHLRARAAGFHPIEAVLDRERARQQTALDAVYHKLIERRPVQLEDAVRVIAPLELYQCAEGAMQWRWQRVYPSADLLMYLDGEFPYDQPNKAPPLIWERSIQVLLTAVRHRLAVDIAPLLPAWIQPRGQALLLARAAKRLGLQPRKWEQHYLEQFKEPHPDLGQRVWRIPVDAETTSVTQVLTHLVIVALKQEFPVSLDDQQTALQWVQHVVQEGLRRLGEGDSQQGSKEVVGEVFEALRTRFDLPTTPWALQDFIKATAQGYVRDARKKDARQPGEPWPDPATGERRYPDAWVAQDIDRDKKTVKRWKADHGITRKGCSETELVAIRQEYALKKERKRIWERGKACGMSDDSLKKLFQRKKKLDGTSDLEAIEAHIKRREKKAEETAPSENTISIEDQIAEWEARLAEAELGSDEWCVARDAIEQLQRRQAGAQP
jgi:hypothetical protein